MYYLLDIGSTCCVHFDLNMKFFTFSFHPHGQIWTKYNNYASVHTLNITSIQQRLKIHRVQSAPL